MFKTSKPRKKIQVLSRLLTIHALVLGLENTPANIEAIKRIAKEINGMKGQYEVQEIMKSIFIPDKE